VFADRDEPACGDFLCAPETVSAVKEPEGNQGAETPAMES